MSGNLYMHARIRLRVNACLRTHAQHIFRQTHVHACASRILEYLYMHRDARGTEMAGPTDGEGGCLWGEQRKQRDATAVRAINKTRSHAPFRNKCVCVLYAHDFACAHARHNIFTYKCTLTCRSFVYGRPVCTRSQPRIENMLVGVSHRNGTEHSGAHITHQQTYRYFLLVYQSVLYTIWFLIFYIVIQHSTVILVKYILDYMLYVVLVLYSTCTVFMLLVCVWCVRVLQTSDLFPCFNHVMAHHESASLCRCRAAVAKREQFIERIYMSYTRVPFRWCAVTSGVVYMYVHIYKNVYQFRAPASHRARVYMSIIASICFPNLEARHYDQARLDAVRVHMPVSVRGAFTVRTTYIHTYIRFHRPQGMRQRACVCIL